MARVTDSPKQPNRFKQMWQVLQMTRRYEPTIVWWLILILVACVGAGILLGFFIGGGVLGMVLYIVAGVMLGLLLDMILLGRRAERAAYSQIEGQPGAVGAVLKSGLRRTWTGSEMPVNVSPRTRDAVYRAVGRGGVVLIAEGPRARTQRMLEDERRNVNRIAPNVPVNFLYVGEDPDSTPLYRLPSRLQRFKRTLTAAEVSAVSNRLASLAKTPGGVGIPKGIDPTRVRAPRPR